jgi:hypothetical protein
VAEYWGVKAACHDCGTREDLSFDHWDGKKTTYEADSVRMGHSDQRAREAMQHPERFQIRCWPCHRHRELREAAKVGLWFDGSRGDQVRTLLTHERWRSEKLKLSELGKEASEVYVRSRMKKWNEMMLLLNKAEFTIEEFQRLEELEREYRGRLRPWEQSSGFRVSPLEVGPPTRSDHRNSVDIRILKLFAKSALLAPPLNEHVVAVEKDQLSRREFDRLSSRWRKLVEAERLEGSTDSAVDYPPVGRTPGSTSQGIQRGL